MHWPKQIQQKEGGHPVQPTKDHWHKPSSIKQYSSTKHSRNKAVKRTTSKATGKPNQTNQTINPFNAKRKREERDERFQPCFIVSFFPQSGQPVPPEKGSTGHN